MKKLDKVRVKLRLNFGESVEYFPYLIRPLNSILSYRIHFSPNRFSNLLTHNIATVLFPTSLRQTSLIGL